MEQKRADREDKRRQDEMYMEEKSRADDLESEERLMKQTATLSKNAGDSTITVDSPELAQARIPSLPRLEPDEHLGAFLTTFETLLRGANVPEEEWKYQLIAQVDKSYLEKLADRMRCDDFTYDELVTKFGGMDCETNISAAEHFYMSEVEGNKFKTVSEALNSTFRWVNKMTG